MGVVCMIIFLQSLIKIIFATDKIERPPYPKLIDWTNNIPQLNVTKQSNYSSNKLQTLHTFKTNDIMNEITNYLDAKSTVSLMLPCKLAKKLCKDNINNIYSNMYKFMNFSNNFTGYDIYNKIPFITNTWNAE